MPGSATLAAPGVRSLWRTLPRALGRYGIVRVALTVWWFDAMVPSCYSDVGS